MCSNIGEFIVNQVKDPSDNITQLELPTEQLKQESEDGINVGPNVLQKTKPALNWTIVGQFGNVRRTPAGTIPSTTDRERQSQTTAHSRKGLPQTTAHSRKRQAPVDRPQLQATVTADNTIGTAPFIWNTAILDMRKESSTDNTKEGDVSIANIHTKMGQMMRILKRKEANEIIIKVKIIARQSTQAATVSNFPNIISDIDNCETPRVSSLCDDTVVGLDEDECKNDTEPSRYFINDDG